MDPTEKQLFSMFPSLIQEAVYIKNLGIPFLESVCMTLDRRRRQELVRDIWGDYDQLLGFSLSFSLQSIERRPSNQYPKSGFFFNRGGTNLYECFVYRP